MVAAVAVGTLVAAGCVGTGGAGCLIVAGALAGAAGTATGCGYGLDCSKKTWATEIAIGGALGPLGRLAPATRGAGPTLRSVRATGTVWDDITPTASAMPETMGVPATFRLGAGGNEVWVNANGSEHLGEYGAALTKRGVSPEMRGLHMQQRLRSFQAAVEAATKNGVPKRSVTVESWELAFGKGANDELPVIIHALYRGR